MIEWITRAKDLFHAPKPEHFTNYRHCEECAEHDETLGSFDIESIGIEQLGSPAWDPLCFSSAEGKKYYMPALIRLALETIESEFYLAQLLFHLEADGIDNKLVMRCNSEQRQFIVQFLEHIIETYPEQLDMNSCANDILRVIEIWSNEP